MRLITLIANLFLDLIYFFGSKFVTMAPSVPGQLHGYLMHFVIEVMANLQKTVLT